jgi:hypothetical protein
MMALQRIKARQQHFDVRQRLTYFRQDSLNQQRQTVPEYRAKRRQKV